MWIQPKDNCAFLICIHLVINKSIKRLGFIQTSSNIQYPYISSPSSSPAPPWSLWEWETARGQYQTEARQPHSQVSAVLLSHCSTWVSNSPFFAPISNLSRTLVGRLSSSEEGPRGLDASFVHQLLPWVIWLHKHHLWRRIKDQVLQAGSINQLPLVFNWRNKKGSLHCIAPKMSHTILFNLFDAHVTQSTIHRFQAAMDLDPDFILLPACDRQIAQKPSKHLQTSSEQQGKWSRHKNS